MPAETNSAPQRGSGNGRERLQSLLRLLVRRCAPPRASSRKSAGFRNIFARWTIASFRLAAVWLTGRPFAQSDSRPLNVGWAVIYRALLMASGISESDLRAIGRKHNDAGLTAAEVMRAKPGPRSLPLLEVGELFARLREARGPVLKTEILTESSRRCPRRTRAIWFAFLPEIFALASKRACLKMPSAAAFDREIGTVLRSPYVAWQHWAGGPPRAAKPPRRCRIDALSAGSMHAGES